MCSEVPAAKFEISLLGREDGRETPFNVMERGSSLYSERSNAPRTQIALKTQTLDSVLRRYPHLGTPLLLKLDVQGAELDVLAGGSQTLASTEVVQLEVALMHYNEGAPDIISVVNFMDEHDLVFFDVCGFVKPDPRYLSQIDLLFVRRNSNLRTDHFTFDI